MELRGITRASVAAFAVAALATGCGGASNAAGANDGGRNTASADDRAKEVVQKYLDAVKAKDTATGKKQVCPGGHQRFDQEATSEDGDFSPAFTLNQAAILGVERTGDDDRKVTANMVVKAKEEGANAVTLNLVFTVQELGEIWCIYEAQVQGTPSPTAG